MHSRFELHEWCITSGLNHKTETVIPKEELTIVEALLMLEPSNLREIGLPLGQRKLFQRALLALRPKEPPQANPPMKGLPLNLDLPRTARNYSLFRARDLPTSKLMTCRHEAHYDCRCLPPGNASGKAFGILGLGTDSLTTPQPAQATAAGTSLPPPHPCQPSLTNSSQNRWRNACSHRKRGLC